MGRCVRNVGRRELLNFLAGLLLFFLWAGTCGASPSQLGDLNGDGVVDVRDLVLLLNHVKGTVSLPPAIVPYADINQDGQVNQIDAGLLANIILGLAPPTQLPLAHLLKSSPAQGESDVSVTRPTVFKLTIPLSASAVVTTNNVYATFGGRHLLSWVALSADRQTVSLFYQEPMPGASLIRVVFDGTGLTDFLGRPLDLSQNGTAGGQVVLDFDTLNNNALSGTIVAGRVFASELATVPGSTNDVNQPLAGVTITVDGQEQNLRAVTDQFGNFRLDPAPSGDFFVHIDGRTATNGAPGAGYPNGAYYPYVGKEWTGTPGQEVNIGNIYLPLIAAGTLQPVSATQPTTITFPTSVLQQYPQLNGVSLTVAANNLFSDDGTRGGSIGLAPVPPDRLPSPLPPGLQFSLVITVQSDGPQNFDQPVPCCFPNLPDPTTGQVLPPGAKSALWSFNHRDGRWEIQGSMTVSADGHLVCTDPGVGISFPGWHGVQPGDTGFGGPIVTGGGPKTDQEPPSCQPGNPTDPVHLFSGEFQEQAVDLAIKGRGMDFAWTRRYLSRVGPNTRQGNRWDCQDNVFLEAQDTNVVLHDGNTRLDQYVPQSDGSYASPGFFRQLVRNGDGTFTLTFADKGQWIFYPLNLTSVSGKRSAIVDRNGNTISFQYDAQGRLAVVVDTLGRTIQVAYNAQGYIGTLTDFAGRVVRYTYYDGIEPGGNAGDLKSVTTPTVTGTPNGNDFPNGKTVSYTYSTGFLNDLLNHNLLSITDGRRNDTNDNTFGQGPYLVNIYSSTTDPNDPNFDRVVRQLWGGDSLDLVYVPILPSNANGNCVMKTIVRDRNGNVKEYFYDDLNRMVRSREYTGRADSTQPTTELSNRPANKLRSSDPDYFETVYEWTDDSLQRRITYPNGNVTEYTYEEDLNPGASPRIRGNLRMRTRLPGTHLPTGDQPELVETYSYDTDFASCCGFNFVTQKTDARGNVSTFDYDTNGNLIRAHGRISSAVDDFEYNSFGQMTAHVWPDNGSGQRRRDVFVFNASGPAAGYLYQQIVDAGHLALTNSFSYDLVGNLTNVLDSRGKDSQFVVNPLNQVVRESSREVTDGTGIRYQRDFYYDANNNLAQSRILNLDEQGVVQTNAYYTTTFEYEILNQIVQTSQEIDPGHDMVTEYAYDANRNRTLVRYGEATAGRQLANLEQMTYDERDLIFRSIRAAGDPQQSTTQYDYDANKNLVAVSQGIEGVARVQTYAFDGYNRPSLVTDPMGNLTYDSYDANGNTVHVVVQGELHDVPGSATNVRLKDVGYTYDAMDRLVEIETALFDAASQTPIGTGRSVAQLFYSDNSQMIRGVNDNAHQLLLTYDTANRRSTVTDANGNSVTYTYDGNNNVAAITELEVSDLGSANQTYLTTYAYDNLDRLVRRTDNAGHIMEYHHDSRGNLTTRIDSLRSSPQASGNKELMSYDGLNRLIKTQKQLTADGTGSGQVIGAILTTQTWDDTSRLVARTDGNGNTIHYAYDALNRRVQTAFSDGTTETIVYDVFDNPVVAIDPNATAVINTFDLLNRPIRKDIRAGNNVAHDTTFETYAYDGLSRIVLAQDDSAVVMRSYDSMNHLTVDAINGQTNRMSYDGLGNLLAWTYSSGRQVSYSYDVLNRRKSVSDQSGLIATYEFVGPVHVARRTYANNTYTMYAYDADRRVSQVTHNSGPIASPQVLEQLSFGWDAMNNKTAETDTGGAVGNLLFSYDSAYRLILSTNTSAGHSLTYALDAANNRLTVTGGSDPGTYVLSASSPPADRQMNRYTSTPFDSRTYDANGNLVSTKTISFTTNSSSYDYRNRLVAWSDTATGISATFQYDALGRRISKIVQGGTVQKTFYSYKGWQISEEKDGTGTTIASYVYGLRPDEVLTVRRGSSDYYLYGDDLDTVRRVVDSTGATVEQYAYGDFGSPQVFNAQGQSIPQSAINNHRLFTGRPYDPETGLYEMRTRYLEPRSGRFITRDIGGTWFDRQSLGNDYVYAANSPYTAIDPFGLSAQCPSNNCPCNRLADVAAVSAQPMAPLPPQPKGKVLVLVDRSQKQFLKSQDYFKSQLEARGYSIVSYNVNDGKVYDQSGNSRQIVDSDYKDVQGLLVIGHGMSGQLANLSPEQILGHLDKTGPVKFIGLWGCHSIEIYDDKQDQFNAHLKPGGAVFGYNTFLQNGAGTSGFNGGFGGLGSFFSRDYSDPLVQFVDGKIPGDIYTISDRWGAFWGTILGGGD